MLNRRTIAIAALALSAGDALAQPADIKAELTKIVETYSTALRGKDVETLMALYGSTPVFTRDTLPAKVGREAIAAGYREIFATMQVDLKFTVHEAEASGDLAWVRATSIGRIKMLSSGLEADDAYNLLIVFRRENGAWKIRNYLYASGGSPTR
jgi:ketosteroid isomerase-like protein